jgi:hypothetical protein
MEALSIGNGTVVSHCAGDIFSAAIDDNGQLYLWAPAFEDAQDQTASVPKPFHGFTHSIETVAIGEENFVSVGYRHTAAALDCSPFIPFAVL